MTSQFSIKHILDQEICFQSLIFSFRIRSLQKIIHEQAEEIKDLSNRCTSIQSEPDIQSIPSDEQ